MTDRNTSPQAAVEAVLAGDASYDSLPYAEQAAVRATWDQHISDRLDGLDFAAEFEAAGESWVEADEDGDTITRNA
jgi:hypothetical protein